MQSGNNCVEHKTIINQNPSDIATPTQQSNKPSQEMLNHIKSSNSNHFHDLAILASALYRFWSPPEIKAPQLEYLSPEKDLSQKRFVITYTELCNFTTTQQKHALERKHSNDLSAPFNKKNFCYSFPKKIQNATPIWTLGNEFIEKNSNGLAALLVISITLGQTVLDPAKVFFIPNDNYFLNFNFEYAFCNILEKSAPSELNLNIEAVDLQSLPFITKYQFIKGLELKKDENSLKLANNILSNNFNNEKYRTLLKIILTPDLLIENLVEFYIANKNLAGMISSLLISRKNELEKQALMDIVFREYIFKQSYALQKDIVNEYLQLSLSEKLNLGELFCQNDQAKKMQLEKDVLNKIEKINSPEAFLNYILEDKSVTNEYKKIVIKDFMTDIIQSKENIEDLLVLYKKISTDNLFKPIKERDGFFVTYSLFGYSHKDDYVSKTFSSLIKAIKNQMLLIAIKKAIAGDNKSLLRLQEDDFANLLNEKRFRTFSLIDTPTQSALILSEALGAKDMDQLLSIIKKYELEPADQIKLVV